MKKILETICTVLAFLLLSGCASICDTKSFTKNVSGTVVVLPESKIPCEKVADYELAAEYAIDALFSNEFENRLQDFMDTRLLEGKHVEAWEGLSADEITQAVRQTISGTYADTYGGIYGLFLNVFTGNIAYDGTLDGPIRMNRWPLRKRGVPQIANTIVHEVAHRAGYSHPSSSSDLKIADLEPPYVIGNIIEEIVAERLEAN